MKRFIVGAEPLTKEQEREFRDWVKSNRGSWWHWVSNMWLLTFDDGSSIEADDIWTALNTSDPKQRIIVLDESLGWVVTDAKQHNGQRMSSWLERKWSADE